MVDLLVEETLLVNRRVAGLVMEQDLLMNLHVKGRTSLDSAEMPELVTIVECVYWDTNTNTSLFYYTELFALFLIILAKLSTGGFYWTCDQSKVFSNLSHRCVF